METASRGTLWWARIVCLSVFGPYVTGSARTEQIAVFASLLFILVTGWPRMVSARLGPAPFLLAWGGVCAVMLISTVFRPLDPQFYGAQPVSHALSAMALPLALMVITWYWTLSADPVALVRVVAPLIVASLCVNAVIEVAQLSAGKAALGVLPRFWATAGQPQTVAGLAAQNGRYTGIFDQPAEAGIAYGVALLCLIWLARRGLRPSLVTGGAVLVIAGGVLTLSKVFLLAALPVAVVTVLRVRSRVRAAATAVAAAGGVWLAGAAGLLPAWRLGQQALGSLLDPRVSLAAQYTGGRYGTGGTLGPAVADVLHAARWFGFGAGGINVPYDSLWLEVLAVSGVLGVILAVALLAGLAWRWVHLRARLGRSEWHLAGAVLALAIGASAGLPSLTANRAGTLLWLILGVLLTARAASGCPTEAPRYGRLPGLEDLISDHARIG
jgi:hypothetical protein